MQQAPKPRPYHLFAALRPQHRSDGVAPDWALRFGQVDQQRDAFAQGQMAQLAVLTDLRKSKRPHAEQSHGEATLNDGVRGDAQGTRQSYHCLHAMVAGRIATD
jgi:hypothetical protein